MPTDFWFEERDGVRHAVATEVQVAFDVSENSGLLTETSFFISKCGLLFKNYTPKDGLQDAPVNKCSVCSSPDWQSTLNIAKIIKENPGFVTPLDKHP